MIRRIFVQKRDAYDVRSGKLRDELSVMLGIGNLVRVKLVHCYDIEDVSDDTYETARYTIFAEPPIDEVYEGAYPLGNARYVLYTPLPGQYDACADFAEQCLRLIDMDTRARVRVSILTLLYGDLSDADCARIAQYIINPVECHAIDMVLPDTLRYDTPVIEPVAYVDGFTSLTREQLSAYIVEHGLAMDTDDITLCQRYFAEQGREPTYTEIKLLDTYWSDHCRHTTFLTELDDVCIDDGVVEQAYLKYTLTRQQMESN